MKYSLVLDGEAFLLCGAFEPHLGWNWMRMNYRIFQRLLMTGKPSPKRESLRKPTVKSGIPLIKSQFPPVLWGSPGS